MIVGSKLITDGQPRGRHLREAIRSVGAPKTASTRILTATSSAVNSLTTAIFMDLTAHHPKFRCTRCLPRVLLQGVHRCGAYRSTFESARPPDPCRQSRLLRGVLYRDLANTVNALWLSLGLDADSRQNFADRRAGKVRLEPP